MWDLDPTGDTHDTSFINSTTTHMTTVIKEGLSSWKRNLRDGRIFVKESIFA